MPTEEQPLTLPHDLPPPEDYLPGTPWWLWLIPIAILLLLILIAVRIKNAFFNKPLTPRPPSLKNIYQHANTQLDELEPKATDTPLSHFSSDISLVLRECLAKGLNDPILYETDEETAARADSLDRLPDSVRTLLLDLSQAKYAPSGTSESQSENFLSRARESIREIHKTLSQEEKS